MKNNILCLTIACLVSLCAPVRAEGVRVQLEEILFKIVNGQSHPVDHQVVDVFMLEFTQQYGSIDRESANGRYGASYFEVPASANGRANHNIYVYVGSGGYTAITDGYHNGGVADALFKMTVMTTRKEGDTVRVRTVHVINPPARGGKLANLREIQAKVDASI